MFDRPGLGPDLVVFTGDVISGRSMHFPDMTQADAEAVFDRRAPGGGGSPTLLGVGLF